MRMAVVYALPYSARWSFVFHDQNAPTRFDPGTKPRSGRRLTPTGFSTVDGSLSLGVLLGI